MIELAPLQEDDRVARGPITAVAIASLFVMAGSLAVVVWLMGGLRSGYGTTPPAAPTTIGTVEQTLILDARRGDQLRSSQRAALESLEWVDRDAGVARIPIGRAMDIVGGAGGPTPRTGPSPRGQTR